MSAKDERARRENIRIDVRRSDGEVTRLVGAAGVAVTTTWDKADDAADSKKHTPVVSLRADTVGQLVWMLAALISAVENIHPGAVEEAVLLSLAINSAAPEMRRVLPAQGDR